MFSWQIWDANLTDNSKIGDEFEQWIQQNILLTLYFARMHPVIPSAFLCYAYAHQLNAITYIHLFLSSILTLSTSRPIIYSFGINISTSVSHRCSPLFIGIHLFIHSLSHLASEGLTWRSLRPSKAKVKRTYKPCCPRPTTQRKSKISVQRVN